MKDQRRSGWERFSDGVLAVIITIFARSLYLRILARSLPVRPAVRAL